MLETATYFISMVEEENNNMHNKPTLRQLRDLYNLSTFDLARAASVDADQVYLMLRGLPVSQDVAEQILAGLSRLAGPQYTLADLDVAILEEDVI